MAAGRLHPAAAVSGVNEASLLHQQRVSSHGCGGPPCTPQPDQWSATEWWALAVHRLAVRLFGRRPLPAPFARRKYTACALVVVLARSSAAGARVCLPPGESPLGLTGLGFQLARAFLALHRICPRCRASNATTVPPNKRAINGTQLAVSGERRRRGSRVQGRENGCWGAAERLPGCGWGDKTTTNTASRQVQQRRRR